MTVLPWMLWAVLVSGAILLLLGTPAQASPVFQVEADGARLVLHTGDCQLAEVKNLPRRAVWHENGKAQEGCWVFRQELGVILFYFSDRTVFGIPAQAFVRVRGA